MLFDIATPYALAMPDDADRRHPRLAFRAEAFAGFLADRTVTRCEPLTGGASNTNHKLTLADGRTVVARQYTRGDPQADARALALAAPVLPTPELLWHNGHAAVFAFVQGEHLTADPAALRDAGRAIARLSAVRFDAAGELQADGTTRPFDFATPAGWLTDTLNRPDVKRWLGPGLLAQTRQLVERHNVFPIDPRVGPSLVHGDFRPDNLLVRDARIVAVLDWEFAHAGSWFMDLGNLLRHFDAAAEAPVLAGLRDGGLIPPDDAVDLAKLIDLGSHLEFLTSARSDAFKATRVGLIRELIERFAGR